jgi:hypothetical protein
MRKRLFLITLGLSLSSCVLFLPKSPEGVSTICAATSYSPLVRIIEKMYPDFEARGVEHPVYFDRRDLELARYVMYGKKGIPGQDPVCLPGDRSADGFKLIKYKLRKAEKLVEEMEAAKGVDYVKWDKDEGRMLYKDASGRVLSNDEVNHL